MARKPFWTPRRVGYISKLYKQRISREQMLLDLKLRFHRFDPGFSLKRIEQAYFGAHAGARPNFEELFAGKSTGEIDLALRAWYDRNKAARARQGEVWKGKLRPDMSAMQKGVPKGKVAKPARKRKVGVLARERIALQRRGRSMALSQQQRAARSGRAKARMPWLAAQAPKGRAKMSAAAKARLLMDERMPSFAGRSHSKETKAKMSAHWKSMSPQALSELKRKISAGVSRRWKSMPQSEKELLRQNRRQWWKSMPSAKRMDLRKAMSSGRLNASAKRRQTYVFELEERGLTRAKERVADSDNISRRTRKVLARDLRSEMENKELQIAISDAVASLPKFEADAVMLHFGLEDGVAREPGEIARKLGSNEAAVNKALSSAFEKIAQHPVLLDYFKPK